MHHVCCMNVCMYVTCMYVCMYVCHVHVYVYECRRYVVGTMLCVWYAYHFDV